MYNDFVIVGPKNDPANISDTPVAADALIAVANSRSLFISRGDESGTHKKERELWSETTILPRGRWYREIGAGMGAALNMAAAENAYVVTDRGTWLSFGNKQDLQVLLQGDVELYNPYGIILVNPEKHPHVDIDSARRFADWLISDIGQHYISTFQINGEQLFCPFRMADIAGRCPSAVKQ